MTRRDALKLIPIGGITSVFGQTRFGLAVAAADWYVDSVNGSDSNTGKLNASNIPQPFQTIAKLLTATITSGQTIAFARGSHWREQFTVPVTVQCTAYGSGAKPLFDASDLISSGAWSKTAGQTVVYQVDSMPLDDSTAADNFVNVWENGTFLTRALSVADCNANAGTYFPSGDGGATISIYVHSTDGSNPGTNGKTYEYSRRSYGIQAYPSNCKFYGLETTKNLNLVGSMFLATGGYMSNCQFSWGSKHCVLMQHSAILEDCVCLNSYFNSTDTMFVYYETTATTDMWAKFIRCTANQNWQARPSSIGFFGHAGAGTWGTITGQDCTAIQCGTAWAGGQSTVQYINNLTVTECNTAVEAAVPTFVTGGTWTMPTQGNAAIYCDSGVNMTVRNVTAIGGKGGSGFIRTVSETGVIADVQNCNISGFITCVQFFGPAVTLTFQHNIVQAGSDFYVFGATPTALSADFNTFTAPGTGERAQIGSNHYTYAQWKALGYDVNSTP